ncbi:20797_t:CDS:2, partial [Racocetra persica]
MPRERKFKKFLRKDELNSERVLNEYLNALKSEIEVLRNILENKNKVLAKVLEITKEIMIKYKDPMIEKVIQDIQNEINYSSSSPQEDLEIKKELLQYMQIKTDNRLDLEKTNYPSELFPTIHSVDFEQLQEVENIYNEYTKNIPDDLKEEWLKYKSRIVQEYQDDIFKIKHPSIVGQTFDEIFDFPMLIP